MSARIGIFGGAFDPPHLMHRKLIEAAIEQMKLDELRVVPTGHAWHKVRELSSAKDRLTMSRLAFGEMDKVVIDDREIFREGPTYTIDTVREIQEENRAATLVLVIGEDQARAFGTWHEAEELKRLVIICVARREDSNPAASKNGVQQPDFRDPSSGFAVLTLPPTPLSATSIRSLVSTGQGIGHLVDADVARYIEQHHLYQIA